VLSGDLDHLRSLTPTNRDDRQHHAPWICAPPGRKFLIADLSGIESRVVAWVSGQQTNRTYGLPLIDPAIPRTSLIVALGVEIFNLPAEQARDTGKVADRPSPTWAQSVWRKPRQLMTPRPTPRSCSDAICGATRIRTRPILG
jgi:hypothetical protein